MTCHPLHNFGAHSTRQGTASLGRINPLGSAGPIACVHALIEGVMTYSPGGRTP